MLTYLKRLRTTCLGVLGVAVLSLVPADASAGWLGLRNDTQAAVIVQRTALGKPGTRSVATQLLFPGEVAWDCFAQPGLKKIAVYDPKRPGQALSETQVPCNGADLFLSIQSPAPGRVGIVPTRAATIAVRSAR